MRITFQVHDIFFSSLKVLWGSFVIILSFCMCSEHFWLNIIDSGHPSQQVVGD